MADCSSFEQIDNATKPLLSAKQPDEIVVRVVPDRRILSQRLMGAGAKFSPGRSAVDELLRERQEDPS